MRNKKIEKDLKKCFEIGCSIFGACFYTGISVKNYIKNYQ